MWILLDKCTEGKDDPMAVNLDTVTDIVWEDGVVTIEFTDSTKFAWKASKQVFIDIISQLNICKEIE